MGRRSTATLFTTVAAIGLAWVGSATAARSLTTGFSEFSYQSADSGHAGRGVRADPRSER